MADFRSALILPAAGDGTRMGYTIAKPCIPIAGRPAIYYTLSAFAEMNGLSQVIIPARDDIITQIDQVASGINWPAPVDIRVIKGGAEREDSIRNALTYLNQDIDIVAVHDAVRPCIVSDDINKCAQKARLTGAAIVGVPCRDTLKKTDNGRVIHHTVDRSMVWHAQTPQCFNRELLLKAYGSSAGSREKSTDDASLIEQLQPVSLVEGSYYNIKLTYPEDLAMAELIIQNRSSKA